MYRNVHTERCDLFINESHIPLWPDLQAIVTVVKPINYNKLSKIAGPMTTTNQKQISKLSSLKKIKWIFIFLIEFPIVCLYYQNMSQVVDL